VSTPNSLPLPEPSHVNPDRIIENVYRHNEDVPLLPHTWPIGPGLDLKSRWLAERYLKSRHTDDSNNGLPPEIVEVSRFPRLRFESWRWDWRVALGVAAASFLLPNAVINADSIKNEAEQAIDYIGHELGFGNHKTPEPLGHPQTKVIITKHETTQTSVSSNEVGITKPSDSYIGFLEEFRHISSKSGAHVKKIIVQGNASDDYLAAPGGGFGVRNSENSQLAHQRAELWTSKLKSLAKNKQTVLPLIEVTSKEWILSAEMHEHLEGTARHFGYANLAAAEAVYDHSPESLPPALHNLISAKTGKSERGVSAFMLYEIEGKKQVTIVPHVEKQEQHNDWDFWPWLIPIPPLPFFKKVRGAKTKYIPGIEPEDQWLRVYEEALEEDGKTLRKDAWAYTRKYQALLREDRIKQVYQGNFLDPMGREQNLRLLFIDHEPTQDTLEAFAELLKSFSNTKDGDFTPFLDAIAVYPTKDAGQSPEDPKRIGLGIDIQYKANVMGVAIPTLRLVEMHMQPDATKKDLSGFNHPTWIFNHEVQGHFSDHNEEDAVLTQIQNRSRFGRRQRRYVASSQWADRAEEHYRQLQSEAGHPRQWLVRLNGKEILVDDNDPRLNEAELVRAENRFPTRYSKTNKKGAELWAEAVAQAGTGNLIPGAEQQFPAQGPAAYAIGSRMLELIKDEIGSDPEADVISWLEKESPSSQWREQVSLMPDNEDLRHLATQARRWDFRRTFDPRVLHILTRTRINS